MTVKIVIFEDGSDVPFWVQATFPNDIEFSLFMKLLEPGIKNLLVKLKEEKSK